MHIYMHTYMIWIILVIIKRSWNQIILDILPDQIRPLQTIFNIKRTSLSLPFLPSWLIKWIIKTIIVESALITLSCSAYSPIELAYQCPVALFWLKFEVGSISGGLRLGLCLRQLNSVVGSHFSKGLHLLH